MTLIRREVSAQFSSVGSLEFEGIAATDAMCSDGYALDMAGGDINRLQSGNAPVLAQHDQGDVVGRIVRAWKTRHNLMIRGKFPTPGVSSTADQMRRLLKDGMINALSLSFTVEEAKRVQGGKLATKWTGYEVSLAPVPVDAAAVITARAHRAGKVLSGVNAQALRDAHDLAEQCRSAIAGVLAGAGEGDEPDADDAQRSADFRRRQADLDYFRRQAEAEALRLDPDRARRQRQLETLVLAGKLS